MGSSHKVDTTRSVCGDPMYIVLLFIIGNLIGFIGRITSIIRRKSESKYGRYGGLFNLDINFRPLRGNLEFSTQFSFSSQHSSPSVLNTVLLQFSTQFSFSSPHSILYFCQTKFINQNKNQNFSGDPSQFNILNNQRNP